MSSRPTTTASTEPISPERFAAALIDLSASTLRLKLFEIQNSISHLRLSNFELLPYALGSQTVAGGVPGEPDTDCAEAIRENEGVIDRLVERISIIKSEVEGRGLSWQSFDTISADASTSTDSGAQDPVATRLNGVRAAIEEEERISQGQEQTQTQRAAQPATSAGDAAGGSLHPAWSDGTFQTGTIRSGVMQYDDVPGASMSVASAASASIGAGNGSSTNGTTGGSLTDEELRRRLEQQMRNLEDDDDDAQGGMHL